MKTNYSQYEIDVVIRSLLNEHRDKLRPPEIVWLEKLEKQGKISQSNRDILIGVYDRIGEAGY